MHSLPVIVINSQWHLLPVFNQLNLKDAGNNNIRALIANAFNWSSTWWMSHLKWKSPTLTPDMTAPPRDDAAARRVGEADLPKLHHCGWLNNGDDDPSIGPYIGDSSSHPSPPLAVLSGDLWPRSMWPIVIICLGWKSGRSMISSGGPALGILSALCLGGDASSFAAHRDGPYIPKVPARCVSALCRPLTFPPLLSPHQSHLISTSGGTMRGRARVWAAITHTAPFINVL